MSWPCHGQVAHSTRSIWPRLRREPRGLQCRDAAGLLPGLPVSARLWQTTDNQASLFRRKSLHIPAVLKECSFTAHPAPTKVLSQCWSSHSTPAHLLSRLSGPPAWPPRSPLCPSNLDARFCCIFLWGHICCGQEPQAGVAFSTCVAWAWSWSSPVIAAAFLKKEGAFLGLVTHQESEGPHGKGQGPAAKPRGPTCRLPGSFPQRPQKAVCTDSPQ